MDSASSSASSSVERRIWKARRCAVLPPMPGSFLSSSMSRAIGSANFDNWSSDSLRLYRSERQVHAAQHAAEGRLHGAIYFAGGLIHGGGGQNLEHFHHSPTSRLPTHL